jgi:hypothetical protein
MSSSVRCLAAFGNSVSAWIGSQDNPGGRTYYNASAGNPVDVPDAAVSELVSQGLIAVGFNCPGAASGPTTARPNNKYLPPGFLFADETLSQVVMWDGTNFRNVFTGATA